MMAHLADRRIHLAHARTASRATEKALERIGFQTVPGLGRHARLYDAGSPVTPANRDEWSVSTTVRNHWDAAVSWVLWDLVDKPLLWDPWDIRQLERVFRIAKPYIKGGRMYALHLDEADVMLRFETLDADLEDWVGGVELERHGVSKRRHEIPPMTIEAFTYIDRRFADEIERLGYALPR